MAFQEGTLDLLLVPSGLIIMFAYHLWLLYRRLHLPHTTVIGFEINDKKAWVDKIMQLEKSNIAVPLTVISASITTATFLASVSLSLCSLIGAWIANSSVFQSNLVYGDKRASTMSIKYISLLICFLLAFSSFVQSLRLYLHAAYLISLPPDTDSSNLLTMTKYVELDVIRGDDFWNLGLRSLYFALCLLLWFLGPVPMFATSVATILLLHFLDTNTKPLIPHRLTLNKSGKGAGGGDRTDVGAPIVLNSGG